ncbi:UTP--glucose-1-phosphate uridylyltransferase [Candidatus Dojkabacteria bacterium]|nr:UTP--glucose-1-phosphate uridylyltransferase [Candidatus Dojkabacteria bacterium]
MDNSKKVTMAVIAAAGYGTRFLPATKSVPKEMLPMIDTPIIQYIVEEIVSSGIRNIIIVTRHGNDPIEDHFDSLVQLESYLEERGKFDKLEEIRKSIQLANIAFTRQHRDLPYGNAAPLLAAKPFLGESNFCYMYGDDLTLSSKVPITRQLVDVFERSDCDAVIAAQKMPKSELSRYANIKFKEGSEEELDNLIEKPDTGEEYSDLASFGRYVCSPRIFEHLGTDKRGKDDEIWFPDGIDKLAQVGKVLVKSIDGKWMTTGDPLRFIQTTLEFAMVRDELKEPLLEYMAELVKREK